MAHLGRWSGAITECAGETLRRRPGHEEEAQPDCSSGLTVTRASPELPKQTTSSNDASLELELFHSSRSLLIKNTFGSS